MNFEYLPLQAAEVLKTSPGQSYDAVLMRLFKECLLHYEKITKYVKNKLPYY